MGKFIEYNQKLKLTQNGKAYIYDLPAYSIMLDSNGTIESFCIDGNWYFAAGRKTEKKSKRGEIIKQLVAAAAGKIGAHLGSNTTVRNQVIRGIAAYSLAQILTHLPDSSPSFGYYHMGKRYFEKAEFSLA